LALNGGLMLVAAGWAASQVIKLVKKEWVEATSDGVASFLNTNRIYLALIAFVILEWLASLFVGGLELKDPSGTGGSLMVAVRQDTSEPAEKDWKHWDAKKPYHDGPWFMIPWQSKEATIFIQGVPHKQARVLPWWRAGESHKLEYPHDFLRPVILVTAERQLVLYAHQATNEKKPYRLELTIGGVKYGPVDYDGHSVWVGCGKLDGVPVPADVQTDARKDWEADPNPTLLIEKVLRPCGFDEFKVEIPRGLATAAISEPGKPTPKTQPVAITVFQPTGLSNQVHHLKLTLPPPPPSIPR